MRVIGTLLVAMVLAACHASGQTPTPRTQPAASVPPPAIEEEDGNTWTFSAWVYTYVVPDEANYALPTVTADRGWLHLEARYNYEDLKTGSVWAGYNFGGGEKLAWELTPMLGGVFGNTTGIAPGYKGSLSWWRLELYSEGEYVFDIGESSDSFFYNWSELSLAPVDWFRFGLVTQRTRVYKTARDIRRGILVGFSFKRLDLATYVLDPDTSQPTVVVAVGLSF